MDPHPLNSGRNDNKIESIQLEFRELSKNYGSNRALQPLSHKLDGGKIHALIGKNGSGKSTLIKILAGATEATSGEILLNGVALSFNNPQDAINAGIVTIHQELSLIPELSVAENIFLGRMPKVRGFIRWAKLHAMAKNLLVRVGAQDIDPTMSVSNLSVGKQQVVEIAKAMSYAPRVLQLDEPTSALASNEVDHLFTLLRRLRDQGVLLIYVSHRLSELSRIADDVVVLRDGVFVGTAPISEANPSRIVSMMFGEIDSFKRREKNNLSENSRRELALEVKHLNIPNLLSDISFKLYKGEILGIAGLLGSGRTELLRAIFGADPVDSACEITVGDKVVNIKKISPELMRSFGVGYTSEDRKVKGLVQILSCHANLCLAGMRKMAKFGMTSDKRERPFVNRQIADLQIKLNSTSSLVSSLSGGNQQKIVVGNWLNINPKIILFDEPSRGVDVQAKQQIYQIMWQLAQNGLAAIVVSTELEELPAICDRILVLKQGRIRQEFDSDVHPQILYEACM